MAPVKSLDEAVDPAKAQCFVQRIHVVDGHNARVLFMENEPYLAL